MKETPTERRPGTEAEDGHAPDGPVAPERAVVRSQPAPPAESTPASPAIGNYAAVEEAILIPPRRHPLRLALLGLLALAVAAAVVYFLFFQPGKPLQTATVHRGTIISSVETTGKLEAGRSARLAFKSSGRVDKVLVKQGDTVKAGQVLAELDTSYLQRNVDQAKVQLQIAQLKLDQAKQGPTKEDLSAAQSRLQAAKASRDQLVAAAKSDRDQASIAVDQATNAVKNAQGALDKAKRDNGNKKYADLTADQQLLQDKAERDVKDAQSKLDQANLALSTAKQNVVSQQTAADAQVNEAQAALDRLNAGPSEIDLAILQQQVNLAQIGVDNANAQLADAQLVSPVSGTVLSFDPDVGDLVGAQQPVATVADVNSLRIKSDIDEIDVGRVSPGQAVTVTLDAYPGVKMPGQVESLAPGATQKQGSTVYQATISFTPVQGVSPREGMAANVDITAQRKDNVLMLPNRAFETVGTRQYVTVLDKGQTSKVEVETGLSNTTDTEVVSGLSEGQVVVVK